MSLLTRDQILTTEDLPFEDVEVPEWGGTVRVRTLTGTDRDQFEGSMRPDKKGAKPKADNVRAGLCAASIIDETGQRLFTPDDVSKLGMKSAKALDRVFDVAARLSGLSEDDVKEMSEDFDGAQSGDSPSD